MILWNALWKNRDGITSTMTLPVLRVFLRTILTGDTKRAFDMIHNDQNKGERGIVGGKNEDDVWVIRRKPSNPDYKNKGIIGGLSGMYTSFQGMFLDQ